MGFVPKHFKGIIIGIGLFFIIIINSSINCFASSGIDQMRNYFGG
jgi:hypothetical protein